MDHNFRYCNRCSNLVAIYPSGIMRSHDGEKYPCSGSRTSDHSDYGWKKVSSIVNATAHGLIGEIVEIHMGRREEFFEVQLTEEEVDSLINNYEWFWAKRVPLENVKSEKTK